MSKQSAAILLYKKINNEIQVLLVHPGGPFWAKKDLGAWSLPKGEFGEDENNLEAAKREFFEETSFKIGGNFIELTPIKQKSGKIIYAFAAEGDLDVAKIKSNTFEMEWPPKSAKGRSGRKQSFPEVNRGEWFTLKEARQKIIPGQVGFLEELENRINNKLIKF
jgi:predicted NUDIX family NTP pyrophosphohydrolase